MSLTYSFILFLLRMVTLIAFSDSFTFTTCQNLLPQIPISSVLLRWCGRISGLIVVPSVERYVAVWTDVFFPFISATIPDLNYLILFIKYCFITHRHTIFRKYCSTSIFWSFELSFILIHWATENNSIYTQLTYCIKNISFQATIALLMTAIRLFLCVMERHTKTDQARSSVL